jgi:hypothetical protein
MLGIEGPPRFVEQWSHLSDAQLAALVDLARRQAERFEAESETLGVELGEARDDPNDDGWNV